MAIKQLLELVGDDIVIAKLKNVQKTGEETLNAFNKSLPELKLPIDPKPIQEFTGHVTKLSDVLKVLKPALSEAGVAVGGLGAFGRIANVSLAGLGAALTGAVIVKLADLEEATNKSKASLTDLFGSAALGETAFNRLEQAAKSLHTTTADLLPSIESLQRGLDKFAQTGRNFKFVALKREDLPIGFAPDIDKVTSALENFFKVLRASGLDTAQASAAEKEFFAALRSGGQLTADILNKLPTGTVEALAVALGKGALTAEQFIAEVAKAPINIDKVTKGLANFTKQAQDAFDTKAVISYKDSFQDLLKFVEEQFKGVAGAGFSDFLKTELDKFKTDLTVFFRDLKAAKDAFFAIPGPPIPGISVPAAPPTDAQKALVNQFAQDSNTIKRTNKTTTDSVSADWAEFSSRFDAMTNQIVSDSKLWTDSIVDGSKKAASALKAVQAPAPGAVPPGFLTAPASGVSPFAAAPGIKQTAEQAATTAQNMVASFQAADDQIRLIWIDLVDYIQTSFNDINLSGATQALVQPFQAASDQIGPIVDQIIQKVQQLMQQLQAAAGTASQLGNFTGFGGNPAGAPFAAGGMVRGPGSTTGDSILAWLSNQEFVVNARAVSHYGPDLFAALNAMRLPRDFLSRFSMGGLARSLSGNRFAAGGQVRSGNPVVLKIDRQSFNMTAGDDTITQLKRFAVTAQLSSTGRKPRWVR